MIFFLITIALLVGFLYWYLKFQYLNPYKKVFQPEKLSKDFEFKTTHLFEDIYINVEDNIQLHALHLKIGFPKGVVLYFHGNEGNIDACLAVADDFLIKGYNLFIVDYRGFGKSEGTIEKPDTLFDDALKTYNYLAQLYNEEDIIVYGRSIASPLAAYVASKTSCQSVVLECPPIDFNDIAHYYYPTFVFKTLLKFDYSTEKWMAAIKCPVYFFHGIIDRVIPLECSKKLATMTTVKTVVTPIQSSSHYTLRNYLEYQIQLEKILFPNLQEKKSSEQKPPLIIKPIFKVMNS